MKVYLAGPIQHVDDNGVNWREEMKNEFSSVFQWADPLDKYNSATDAKYVPRSEWDTYDNIQSFVTASEIIEADKELIEDSDVILVGWSEAPSCGTPMEVMYQYMLNQVTEEYKPIIVWWRDSDTADGHISPWMEYHADEIIESRDDVLEYLEGLQLDGLDSVVGAEA